jgi:hypothetical protein
MARHNMANPTVQRLGIDVETRHAKRLVKRLEAQKNTVMVGLGGAYHQDLNISQVLLDTHWTESQLDGWLYKTTGIEYMGTFTRQEAA